MRRWLGGLAVLAGAAVGCRHPGAPTEFAPPRDPPVVLPLLDAAKHESNLLPPPPASITVRELGEPAVRVLAAKNTSLANTLDAESAAPPERRPDPSDQLLRTARHLTALELRTQSAGEALERFYQLAAAEAQADAVREATSLLDRLREQAARAKAANVRYPLDPADLDRQRSQFQDQADQAGTAVLALNVDLRRRLGLDPAAAERLWPVGDFATDPAPTDPDVAAEIALCDRPGLRMLRSLYLGLTAATLPAVRDQFHALNPLLATPAGDPGPFRGFAGRFGRSAEAHSAAELATRRQQLWDAVAEQERAVADQARVAALELNARHRMLERARERMGARKSELDEAGRARAAGLAGGDLREAQAELEWRAAKSEVAAAVMGWHAARARLLAAQGRLP